MKNKYLKYINENLHNIEGKKVIITGANSGIGFSICDILLYKGAHIVMACRNPKRAEKAKNDLLLKHPNANIEFISFDQSSFEKIDSFINELISNHSDFYSLVLNAGIFKPNKKDSFYDRVPLTLGVNFISLLYLLDKMQPFLNTIDSPKRIVLEGSLASYISKYKTSVLTNFKVKRMKQYNLSKLGVTNVFMHFALCNKNPNVKYALGEPGISATNIYRSYPKWFKKIADAFIRLIFNDATCGALPTASLICNDIANLAYCKPRGFLSIKGWPKYFAYPNKLYNSKMIEDAYHVIGVINGK